jgi:hypothetical protein
VSKEEETIYRIDENNIVYFLSKNWLHFANANDASERCIPKNIIGQRLDSFIADEQTRDLYTIIVQHVRSIKQPAKFQYRCDAPDWRRLFELQITPLTNNNLEFRNRLLWSEHRRSVQLLRPSQNRSDEVLVICSICNKLELEGRWEEVEVVVNALALLETGILMPTISHAYCPQCFDTVIDSVHDTKR